jgi:hypothetical protein
MPHFCQTGRILEQISQEPVLRLARQIYHRLDP